MKDKHKILLIGPPFYRLFKNTYSLTRYPLALGYLAGEIRKNTNWDVMTYNADFYPQSEGMKIRWLKGEGFSNYLDNLKDSSKPIWKEIKSVISEYKPSVIGISSMSQNFASARMIASLAKEIDKQIFVIVGGPHPSMVGKEVLNCSDIDLCVKGEGEKTITELLNAINQQQGFEKIKGISFRKGPEIVDNLPREFIEDLDSLSFPHESAKEVLKDYNLYPLWAFGGIFATRGCPYNCFFCGSNKIWSRKVRFRTPGNIIKEIKGLLSKGLDRVHFEDDTFGINKQYISYLCNALIEKCPGLKWECEMHVKLVDEKTISLMKKAGCILIQLGIESGNDKILKDMRKNLTRDEALSACRIIKKYGITLGTFFIVGFPQETEESLKDTMLTMKKSKSDFLLYSIFTPYPGTEVFEFCKEKGLIGEDYDASLYNHQSPANFFCLNISPERFKQWAYKIERLVDKNNRYNFKRDLVLRFFSLNTLRKIRELGFMKNFKKGTRILVDFALRK